MLKTLSTGSLVAALMATTAMAQSVAEQVVPQLQNQGYQRIEVRNGPSQVKIEATRDGMELELVYDSRTGALLKREQSRAGDDDDDRPGLEIRDEDRDFVRGGDRDRDHRDDDDDDDEDDDHDDDDYDDDDDDYDDDDYDDDDRDDDEDDHDDDDDDDDDEDDDDDDDDDEDEDDDDD